ncbi:MAG: PDZ domain-containing protein [Gammaproteobacteria bacterium]
MRLSGSPVSIWVVLLAGLLGGCVSGGGHVDKPDPAEAQRFLDETLAVPAGLAMLTVYNAESGALTTRSCVIERAYPAKTSQHCAGAASMFHLLPGKYQLVLMRQTPGWSTVTTINHRIDVTLAAGESRIFKWVSDDAPFVEELSPERARPELSGAIAAATNFKSVRSSLKLHEQQWATVKRHLLNADETDFDPTLDCPDKPLRAKWSNASFEGRFTNCALTHGDFFYNDGTRVRTHFMNGGLGIRFYYNGLISEVLSGSAAERAGITAGQYLHAIDGTTVTSSVPKRNDNVVAALALGDVGSKARLTLSTGPQGPKRTVVTERAMIPGLLSLVPGARSEIHYPDGRRYRGPISLNRPLVLIGQVAVLDLPIPLDASDKINQRLNPHGQLSQPDGSGFLGQFVKGQPEGHGYCYKRDQGQSCFYSKGTEQWRGEKTPQMAPYIRGRDANDILNSLGDLPRQVAIDLLRKRWVDALLAERWNDYLVHMAELQKVGFDTGIEAIYYEGRALQELGWPEQAHDKYEAYINLAGTGGASYADALSSYSRIKGEAQQARQKRLGQISQARDKRRDFCRAQVSSGTSLCGCLEFRDKIDGIDVRQCLN